MGLLDGLFNLSPEQNQALGSAGAKMLELSGPSRVPRSFGQIAGAAYGTFNDSMNDSQERAALKRQRELQEQLLGWKTKDAEADYGHQQSARERDTRIAKRLAGVMGAGGMSLPPGVGMPGSMPSPHQASITPAGQQSMGVPTVGSEEWAQGIQQQAARPSLDAPLTTDPSSPQFWLQSAMPGRATASSKSAGSGAPGAKGGASASNNVDWFALGLPPETAARMHQGQRRNHTQEMVGNLMTKAQIQFEEGDAAGAEKTLDLIQKFRPTATWKEVRQSDGRVVNMPFFSDGQPGEASDAEVAAKLHWQDTGPATLGLDPFDGSVRARHKNGLSPSTAATVGVQRERLAFDKQQAGRPVFNESMGGYMLPPSQQNPAGVFIPASGRRSPKMTEDQAKATGWVVQAENAWKNMQAVAFGEDGKLTSAATPGFGDAVAALPFGIGESSGNHFRSADRQKFIQGASSLSESLLRAATGAGVNRDEAIQKTREITPVWGDSSEVIAQKLGSIPLYIDSLKARAGPGAGVANEVIEKDAARHAGQAAGKFSVTAPNGKTYDFPDAKSLANFKLTTGIR